MKDVLVIGGGVIGTACALELARKGASVTVLERDRIGRACSYGNAGWLTPSLAFPLPQPGAWKKAAAWLLDPESPFYIRPRLDPALAGWILRFLGACRKAPFERGTAALVELCRFSLEAWEALAQAAPEKFGFARDGLIAVYETPGGFAAGKASAELVARFGRPFEVWTEEEVRAREPALQGPLLGAVFYPDDGRCEPYRAVQALAMEARRAGVTFLEDAEVIDVDRRGDEVRLLRTTRGRFFAEAVVLAAGTWSGSLGRRFGLRLPVLGAKGYTLVLPRREPHPARAVYLAERKIAVNPHAERLRISGTLELVGEDLSVNTRRVDAIARGARALLALADGLEEVEFWRGLRPCTPDGMPVIGRALGFRNLWLATGHQMTGLKTAPGTGRLLAELMAGDPPTFDPTPFRADRF